MDQKPVRPATVHFAVLLLVAALAMVSVGAVKKLIPAAEIVPPVVIPFSPASAQQPRVPSSPLRLDPLGKLPADMDISLEGLVLPDGTPGYGLAEILPDSRLRLGGQAMPFDTMTMYVDGHEAARAFALRTGEWILETPEPLAPGRHQASVLAESPDGGPRWANEVIYLNVPASDSREPFLAVALTPGEAGPSFLLSGHGKDVFWQGGLSLDVLDCDADGHCVASGRASPQTLVQVSVDGREWGRTRVEASGFWSAEGTEVIKPGNRTLGAGMFGRHGERLSSAAARLPFSLSHFPVREHDFDPRFLTDGTWRVARQSWGYGTPEAWVLAAGPGSSAGVPEGKTQIPGFVKAEAVYNRWRHFAE